MSRSTGGYASGNAAECGCMLAKLTIMEVLGPVWWIGAVAFVVSLIATPIVRAMAYRLKMVDRPDDLLKPHARPTAYMGGVAMCVGLLAGLACYAASMPDLADRWGGLSRDLLSAKLGMLQLNPLWNLLAIAVSATLIMLVGLLDDIRGISTRQKVLGQIATAAILLLGGIGLQIARAILGTLHLHLPDWVLVPASIVLCMFMVISTCNATNLLDGLDGLCGGVTGIIALGFLALAVGLATWHRFPGTDELRVGLCLAMAGAVLGFLPYNIPPASVFMGDAGSMMLGFFVAIMMALFCREGTARWLQAACVIFALPILDTALAVVRRLLARKSIFTGDRSHLYDQLVDRGMTVRQVVGLFYLLSVVAGFIGVAFAIVMQGRKAFAIYVVLLVIIWTIFHKMGMITPGSHSLHDSSQDRPVE